MRLTRRQFDSLLKTLHAQAKALKAQADALREAKADDGAAVEKASCIGFQHSEPDDDEEDD